MTKGAAAWLPGLFTAFVWGTTFVASKAVLVAGLSPIALALARFVVAYAVLAVLSRILCVRAIPFRWDKGELRLALLGLTSVLYFVMEYAALPLVPSAEVGVLTSTVPIVTTALMVPLGKARVGWLYLLGSLIAMVGVTLVTGLLGGPWGRGAALGYAFTAGAVLFWAAYTVLLQDLAPCHHPIAISRRYFFYSVLSLLPFAVAGDDLSTFAAFADGSALLPTLYLGVVASGLCIWLWNVSVVRLGAVRTNSLLYLLTVVPVVASALFTNEQLTLMTWVGAALVMVGIIVADRDKHGRSGISAAAEKDNNIKSS